MSPMMLLSQVLAICAVAAGWAPHLSCLIYSCFVTASVYRNFLSLYAQEAATKASRFLILIRSHDSKYMMLLDRRSLHLRRSCGPLAGPLCPQGRAC